MPRKKNMKKGGDKIKLKNGDCVVIKSTVEKQVYLSYDINKIRYE